MKMDSFGVQEFYRDGKLEGECKWWYENGQLEEQAFYRDGKLEGEYKWWYENGQLKMQAFYRNGKLEGECKSWYENGQLQDAGILSRWKTRRRIQMVV